MARFSLFQKLLNRLEQYAVFLIGLNLVLIVILTLMPFNFAVPLDFSWETTLSQFKETTYTSDILVNILFFMPFGAGLGAFFYRKEREFKIFQSFIKALSVSFALSLSVEIGQLFLVSREPVFTDLATNSLGGGIGALLFLLARKHEARVTRFLGRFAGLKKTMILLRLLATFWLAYLIFISFSLVNISQSNKLSNWEERLPLLIGNEGTGDRPWLGSIKELCFSDTALKLDFFGQLADKNYCQSLQEKETLSAYYRFTPEKKIYSDLAGNSPSLFSRRLTIGNRERGITLTENNWLVSVPPLVKLNQNIRDRSSFTIITSIATDNFDQEGPARIISLSRDHFKRNLSISQSRRALSFRLRMPFTGINGKKPEIRLSNFFTDTEYHPLAVSYDGTYLQFLSDREYLNKTLYLGSETALFWSVFGILAEKMFLNVGLEPLNNIFYYCFIFAPLGISFGFIYRLLKKSRLGSSLLLSSGLLLPPLLIEGIIVSTSDRSLSWQYLGLGLTTVILSFLLVLFITKNRSW